MLAYRALRRLAAGLTHLAGAAITWKQVAPLFGAADRPEAVGLPAFVQAPRSVGPANGDGRPLLEAHDLVFRYGDRGDHLLRGCTLQIGAGERLLLEGASGGGKSTLASLLGGLRLPESGLVLLDGLDRPSLGAAGWRRRVVFTPQFHENHVLTGTLAFNALMGRDWPAAPADLGEVEAVCRGLGLGELLDRMPAGPLADGGRDRLAALTR